MLKLFGAFAANTTMYPPKILPAIKRRQNKAKASALKVPASIFSATFFDLATFLRRPLLVLFQLNNWPTTTTILGRIEVRYRKKMENIAIVVIAKCSAKEM